ncbi:MAG TPA: hypothetical protein VF723_13195 [Pyrinomonadaceae bacterium]|jgi:hypothetical protein
MNPKNTIKVIKRSQLDGERKAAETGREQSEAAKPGPRDVAAQVTAWVKEFQQRRYTDPRRSFASLFGEPASALN